jgi:hypothetical protein
MRFESIREFEVAIDFGMIKTDKHTGEATEYRLAPWARHRFKPRPCPAVCSTGTSFGHPC